MTTNPYSEEKWVTWFRTQPTGLRFLRERLCAKTNGQTHRWPSPFDIPDSEVLGVTFDSVGRPIRKLYVLVYPEIDDGCREAAINPRAIDDGIGLWQGLRQPLGALASNHSPPDCIVAEAQARQRFRAYWQQFHARRTARQLEDERKVAEAMLAPPKRKKTFWGLFG